MTLTTRQTHVGGSFRHEALLYDGEEDFVRGTVRFIESGLAADQPALIAVPGHKVDLLRDRLGGRPEGVHFVDMATVGRNPACIIPMWRDFVAEHGGGGQVRGIGEPIWEGRSPAALVECQLHESLINAAFADQPPLWLMCPYDVSHLDTAVIAEAGRSHPVVLSDTVVPSDIPAFSPGADTLHVALPDPPAAATEMAFGGARAMATVRGVVAAFAAECGLSDERVDELVLATNEAVTNTVTHGGGDGVMRLWLDDNVVVCQVDDRGRIDEPLVGRSRPSADDEGGRGLWLINRLCDLVQLRSTPTGVTVRLHIANRSD